MKHLALFKGKESRAGAGNGLIKSTTASCVTVEGTVYKAPTMYSMCCGLLRWQGDRCREAGRQLLARQRQAAQA